MKQLLLSLLVAMLCTASISAQTIITSADMPVNGDTLRYSTSLNLTGLNLTDSGANKTWDYSTLTPRVQQVDTYKTAAAANYTGGGIPATAYGYKVADTLTATGAAGVAITNVYTFFNIKTGPSRFVAEGFGAKLNGAFPIPAAYSDEDEIYLFPLTYGRRDSTTFKLTVSVPLVGSLKQQGYRVTKADGWGTIKTPYFTTPKAVVRVRSEVVEIDSITYAGNTFGVPRHTVDYKWLANGEHYPALWITTTILAGNEAPTSVRYRDTRRSLGVATAKPAIETLSLYPNPATGNDVTVKIPSSWGSYVVRVFDAAGRMVGEISNSPKVAIRPLSAGHYTVIAESNGTYGAAQFVK